MTDYDAVKQTIDILARSDLLDEIQDLVVLFQKHKLVPRGLLGFDLYSYAYAKAKQFKKAIEYGEQALELATDIEQRLAVMSNLGRMYLSANDPVKSKQALEYVIEHSGESTGSLMDYSAALFACGEKERSYEIIKRLASDVWQYDQRTADSILFNMGVYYIQQGDFKSGMEHLAIGRRLNVFGSYAKITSLPEWDGKTTNNTHVLMVGEGGIGDEIINVRFVKHIRDLGCRVSILTYHNLASVYEQYGFETVVTAAQFNPANYDCWTPMMSLPKTLNLDFGDLWYGPYLTAKPNYIEKFSTIITGNRRVGVRWAGNPRYDHELHRTIDLSEILNALDDTACDKYSLQRDVGLDQLTEETDVVDLSMVLDSFDDLLGCLHHLDLVITSCTSVAHAAAAMGKRVIVLVPIMEYYVWAEGRKNSSWYGENVTIIRQTEPGSWELPYKELKNILKEHNK